ncbi:hypothetical protein GCM10023075_80940 [Streptosporangium album]
MGPAEPFEPMVEALIAAGARCIGGRFFEVRPPLSHQQVTALHRLAHLDPGTSVTVDPPGSELWHADPTAPDHHAASTPMPGGAGNMTARIPTSSHPAEASRARQVDPAPPSALAAVSVQKCGQGFCLGVARFQGPVDLGG